MGLCEPVPLLGRMFPVFQSCPGTRIDINNELTQKSQSREHADGVDVFTLLLRQPTLHSKTNPPKSILYQWAVTIH